MDRTLNPPVGARLPRIAVSGGRLRSLGTWRIVLALLALVALIAGSVAFVRARSATAVTFTTVPLLRQDLVATVTATGTVNPQNTIAIGSQASGIISEIDADYNSHVHKGQILAKLDPTTFEAALGSARAALAQAENQAAADAASATGARSNIVGAQASAGAARATSQAAQATASMNQAAVASAQANVNKAQSALSVAQQTVDRDRSLLGQGYIAQSQLDADSANLVAAQSAVQSAVVAVRQAQLSATASASQAAATVDQSAAQIAATNSSQSTAAQQAATAAAAQSAIAIQEANVATAEQNLDHTVIRSPVDGTVISRTATIGETVAASFQTPTLFTVAQDLGKMEVDLAVGEPDIGSVRPGESVDFSVLAYPNRTFQGIVSQVRKDSTVTQNVVTYTTVVLVDNRDGTLLPGMTANATIQTAKAPSALVVPLAAFSYTPPSGSAPHRHRRTTSAAGGYASANSSGKPNAIGNAGAASPWGATNGTSAAIPTTGSQARLFVQRNGRLVRVPVKIVLANGTQAAVTPLHNAQLTAGDAIVVGDSSNAAATSTHSAAAGNPLAGGPRGGGSLRGMH